MSPPIFKPLVDHYEDCLVRHGACAQGVGWPREEDVQKRFQVFANMWAGDATATILDLGCGYGALWHYLQAQPGNQPDYWGIDVSAKMIEQAQKTCPQVRFEQRDIIANTLSERCVDYVIINGVLTAKCGMTQAEMVEFAKALLASAFRACRKGIAFNAMNHHADWRRDDLFHWPFDEAAAFIRAQCSRHYAFRADFGLYDYIACVYREPQP